MDIILRFETGPGEHYYVLNSASDLAHLEHRQSWEVNLVFNAVFIVVLMHNCTCARLSYYIHQKAVGHIAASRILLTVPYCGNYGSVLCI